MSANHVRNHSHLQKKPAATEGGGGKLFPSLHMHIADLPEVRGKNSMWFKVLTIG
jgi:hypothetical protein